MAQVFPKLDCVNLAVQTSFIDVTGVVVLDL